MVNKGYKQTEEHKRKVSEALKGKRISEEHRKKISQTQRGKHNSPQTEFKKGHKQSEETIKKRILKQMGHKPTNTKPNSGSFKKGQKSWNEGKTNLANLYSNYGMKGKHQSEESKRKMAKTRGGKYKGENSHTWKGGITPINSLIRHSPEYKLWRKSVFERDNYTCRFCGQRGKVIHADHIKSFSLFPELRFAIDNGRTLCKECHLKTDNYGYRGKNGGKI